MRKIELLAPAGDKDALVSAIASGANAVYFGLDIFNARIRAENFTLDTVEESVRLCHAHGVKAYVTLNTQLYNKELPLMLEYVGKLYEKGVDALIVADFGVASLIKSYYPDFEIHASTQASVHNKNGAELLCDKLGFARVVLARELDRESIEYISKSDKYETEIFVHGAHCMSVSGQCLASFCMGGRSGNRGECAQPCRLPYTIGKERGYPLSLKDMTLSNHIEDILNSGTASLKIEGRMKNSDYVGGTVNIWRRLIDQKRNANKQEALTLSALFSRGGFTDGYFTGKIDRSMLGIRSDKDKETSLLQKTEKAELERVGISLSAELYIGKESKLTLTHMGKAVTVFGDIVESADNAPMSYEDVKKNLVKFGSTPFYVKNIDIKMDEGIMIRNSSLNALRRMGADKLFDMGRKAKEITLEAEKTNTSLDKIKTALFNSIEQIPQNHSYFDIVFLPLEVYFNSKSDKSLVNGIKLPPVVLDKEWDEVEKMLSYAKAQGVAYALVSNIGQVERVKAYGFELMADFRFNVFNSYTLEFVNSLGIKRAIVSPELTLAQLRDFKNQSIIAYGKLPTMVTHKCVLKDTVGCDKCKGYIKDRQGAMLYAQGIYGHRCVIYNSVPVYMADKLSEIENYSHHFIFSDEARDEAYKVIEAYKKGLPTNRGMKRIK